MSFRSNQLSRLYISAGRGVIDEMELEERRRDRALCSKGVAKSTLKKYTAARSDVWDEYLRVKRHPADLDLAVLPVEEQRRIIVRFIRYLLEEKKESADQVALRLVTLQFELKTTCKDIAIFSDATIALARKGMQPSAREKSKKREQRARAPVTKDILLGSKHRFWRYSSSPKDAREAMDDRMTYVGLELAFAFLWRISQYVLDSQCAEHALMCEDVNIFMLDGTVRFPWEMRDEDAKKVERILFVSRSSKNDKGGRGQYMYLQRKSEDEIELLEMVAQWCKESGVRQGDPLLCRYFNGRRKKLTRKMINTSLKVIAASFGLQSVAFAFSSHSLRIGGATSMIAAGADPERVRRLGGWAEGGCAEIYELATPLDDNALSISSTCFKVLTLAEVMAMIPPAKRAMMQRRLVPVRGTVG